MIQNTYCQKTDAFFYDNYNRVWEGANPDRMSDIYIAEMDSLLYNLENGEAYMQEFARDYRLAQQLKTQVNGTYLAVQKERSPYAIVPAQGLILFQKSGETVYQCSYQKCFQILKFYIRQLQQRFPEKAGQKNWEEQLESLKKGRWKSQMESLSKKLRFWDHSPGNPDTHFEGTKKLKLNAGEIASFRQLRCQDTLRSLTVDGLSGVKDLEVLAEYTQLKCLYLNGMGIRDIGFLSSLVNLDELGLAGNQITDLSPLAGMKKLTHLYIADNPVTDFSVVEQLPSLKTLYTDLKQLPDQIAWDLIPGNISLRVLWLTPLEKGNYHAEEIYRRKVPFLAGASSVPKTGIEPPKDSQRLAVKDRWLYSGMINALGYQPAVKYDVAKIKRLDCSDHIRLCDDFSFLTEMGDYSCLASAIKLRELSLSERIVNDFSWLKKCENIQKLNLSGTDFSDLSLLSEMKSLTSLSLSGCHNLKADSFRQLSGLSKLQELNLSDTGFRDLEMLRPLNRLTSLQLEGCIGLEGMEQMAGTLARIPFCCLPEESMPLFRTALVDFFCHRMENFGFRIKRNGSGCLPEPLSYCSAWIPPEWSVFLKRVSSCVSSDGNTWFLTQENYHLHPEIDYPWEREQDWQDYLPIMVSLREGLPQYYIVSRFGNVLYCRGEISMQGISVQSPTLQHFLAMWSGQIDWSGKS